MNTKTETSGITKIAGLPVVYCVPGSAAHCSGVRPGDVIIEVNGVSVTDAISYLHACRLSEEGMRLKVRRGLETLSVSIPLSKDFPKVNVAQQYDC